MHGFEIHRATAEEIDRAHALVEEYFQAASVVLRESREDFERAYFAGNAGLWLATCNGALAGCIALREIRLRGTVLGEIKRMYVRPAHRGQGLGDALLHALEDFAVRHGYGELVLDTTDKMAAAARLYERNGYHRRERYNQNPQATIFMGKKINRFEHSAAGVTAQGVEKLDASGA